MPAEGAFAGTVLGGDALCLSLRCNCLSGVDMEDFVSMFEGEATVLCMFSIASLVREDEAVEEAPSEPSVLSVLCILLSRSDR